MDQQNVEEIVLEHAAKHSMVAVLREFVKRKGMDCFKVLNLDSTRLFLAVVLIIVGSDDVDQFRRATRILKLIDRKLTQREGKPIQPFRCAKIMADLKRRIVLRKLQRCTNTTDAYAVINKYFPGSTCKVNGKPDNSTSPATRRALYHPIRKQLLQEVDKLDVGRFKATDESKEETLTRLKNYMKGINDLLPPTKIEQLSSCNDSMAYGVPDTLDYSEMSIDGFHGKLVLYCMVGLPTETELIRLIREMWSKEDEEEEEGGGDAQGEALPGSSRLGDRRLEEEEEKKKEKEEIGDVLAGLMKVVEERTGNDNEDGKIGGGEEDGGKDGDKGRIINELRVGGEMDGRKDRGKGRIINEQSGGEMDGGKDGCKGRIINEQSGGGKDDGGKDGGKGRIINEQTGGGEMDGKKKERCKGRNIEDKEIGEGSRNTAEAIEVLDDERMKEEVVEEEVSEMEASSTEVEELPDLSMEDIFSTSWRSGDAEPEEKVEVASGSRRKQKKSQKKRNARKLDFEEEAEDGIEATYGEQIFVGCGSRRKQKKSQKRKIAQKLDFEEEEAEDGLGASPREQNCLGSVVEVVDVVIFDDEEGLEEPEAGDKDRTDEVIEDDDDDDELPDPHIQGSVLSVMGDTWIDNEEGNNKCAEGGRDGVTTTRRSSSPESVVLIKEEKRRAEESDATVLDDSYMDTASDESDSLLRIPPQTSKHFHDNRELSEETYSQEMSQLEDSGHWPSSPSSLSSSNLEAVTFWEHLPECSVPLHKFKLPRKVKRKRVTGNGGLPAVFTRKRTTDKVIVLPEFGDLKICLNQSLPSTGLYR